MRWAASARDDFNRKRGAAVADETAAHQRRPDPRIATGWGLAASVYVFTVVMKGTTLPTPLYPL